MWLGHHFQGQKVKGQIAGGRRHIVAASRTDCLDRSACGRNECRRMVVARSNFRRTESNNGRIAVESK